MTVPAVLLTLDEACDLLGASAIALVEAAPCPPGRLARLLRGKGTTRGLPPVARRAAGTHRGVVREVLASDHAWILDDQVEGALAYAECHWETLARTLAA